MAHVTTTVSRSATFDRASYDRLCEVPGLAPAVSPISAGDVAESGHVVAGHQLVGLRRVTEDGNEEQEEHTREVIIHRTWVHGPVTRQEGSAQNVHVLPLQRHEGK